MKNYIYSDDEDFSSNEEEEEFQQVEKKEKKKPVRKQTLNKTKTDEKDGFNEHGFNEHLFDMKVAISISKIHRKNDNEFSLWVNENIEHLEKLYKLSDLTCKEVDFYTYIYENSEVYKNTCKDLK